MAPRAPSRPRDPTERHEAAKGMTVDEFFSWLAVADLPHRDRHETREMLLELLDNIPSKAKYDELHDVLEELVENPDFVPDQLSDMRLRFAHLLPEAQSPLETVEDDIDEIAQRLDEEAYETDRLRRFEKILKGLDDEPDERAEKRLQDQLHSLEAEFRGIWSDYLKLNVDASEITAESVGGHRFLEDAFNMWFQAFELAHELELDEAWESACEGNRLLLAVSMWSDEIRTEATAEIANG